MRRKADSLKLGKSPAFDKAKLRRLRQEDETWDANFRALPKPMMQNETHYLGLVVNKRGGSILAETKVEGRPSASELATLLGKAMRHPLTDGAHRPRRIHVRRDLQWQGLFPHVEELGIKVSVTQELTKVQEAYQGHLRQMRGGPPCQNAPADRGAAELRETVPAIARYVQGYGHVEIGDKEMFGFVARALDYGGVVFEDDRPNTLARGAGGRGERLEEVV
jgi:hypothetical protein